MAVGVAVGMAVGGGRWEVVVVGVDGGMAVGVADGMAVGLDDRMAVGLDDRMAMGDVGLDFFLALEPSLLALDLRLTPLAALEFLLALATAGQSKRAPIKMVNGSAWSPRIYWALRLLGRSLVDMYPKRMLPNGAVRWMNDVFDRKDIYAILWMLGDMYADFGNKRMFILYGPGGIGKSSVVNIIGTAIGGSITKLQADTILINPSSFSTRNLLINNIRLLTLGHLPHRLHGRRLHTQSPSPLAPPL